MKKILFLLFGCICLLSCEEPELSTIEMQNNLPGTLLQDVQLGGFKIADSLLPGESGSIAFTRNNPEIGVENTFSFNLNVDGDILFLETQELFVLREGQDIMIVIDEDTPVFNPLLEVEQ